MVRTAVSLVISFFNLSRKIAKTPWSSARRWSPRWHTMWPIQVMALSFTSWSMSVAFSLFRVTENTLERQQFYKILHTLNTESEIKPDLKTSREQTILTVKPLTFTSLGWLLCWYYSTVKGQKSNHTTDERRKQPCWTWLLHTSFTNGLGSNPPVCPCGLITLTSCWATRRASEVIL